MLTAVSYGEQIAQIATDVFRSMLRIDVDVCDGPLPSTGDVTATVRFEGSWNGALLIQCSWDQAFEFASRLMPIDRPTSFDEDTRDALGEVANMIGGNLKALLPQKTVLSVPEVYPAIAASAWSQVETASSVILQSEVGNFSITLLEESA